MFINFSNIVKCNIKYKKNFVARFTYATNERLAKLIAFQFITTTLVMCSNLYQLTRTTLNTNSIGLFAYSCCVLVQIFIYCWFGNEVKLMVCICILSQIIINKYVYICTCDNYYTFFIKNLQVKHLM